MTICRPERVAAYRGVDGLVAVHVGRLVKTMVGLAEGHAGNAVGDQAEVDGVKAAEEAVVPRLRALGRLGVDMLAGLGQDVVDPGLPVLHILIVDGAVVVGILGLGRSSHCDGGRRKKDGWVSLKKLELS